jgi:flagellar hook-basal body complex protein FliE
MLTPLHTLPPISALTLPASPTLSKASLSFADWMIQQTEKVQRSEQAANNDLLKLSMGKADNLHQVMVNLEQAKLTFQLLLQVRTRALEAYQEIMRMQI